MEKISSVEYCRNFVRSENYDLYLLHFFMPAMVRHAALALAALHCELVLIPQKAQDPSMKIIRLKWWHDEVMKLYEGEGGNDKLSPILELLKIKNISRDMFEKYFQSFQDFLNNQKSDPTAALYELLCALIDNQKSKDRFIALLQYHDELDENTPMRALRLWFKSLNVILDINRTKF